MPIEEKGWKEIEEEYAKAKRKRPASPAQTGRWGKCPAARAAARPPVHPARIRAQHGFAEPQRGCPVCRGSGKAPCPQPGCRAAGSGWWTRNNLLGNDLNI
jgi:hypothetical protein